MTIEISLVLSKQVSYHYQATMNAPPPSSFFLIEWSVLRADWEDVATKKMWAHMTVGMLRERVSKSEPREGDHS